MSRYRVTKILRNLLVAILNCFYGNRLSKSCNVTFCCFVIYFDQRSFTCYTTKNTENHDFGQTITAMPGLKHDDNSIDFGH